MQTCFLILGYGVPENIIKDEKYNIYLKTVFNKIYSSKTKHPIIIACGGKTDLIPPYKRSEAGEIIRFFKNFIQERPHLKTITATWRFIPEDSSLSTLENLLHSKKIILDNSIKEIKIIIFCEQTRKHRVQKLSKIIFKHTGHVTVKALDFDVSEHRYLPRAYLHRKENLELQHSRWALLKPENLKKHHAIFLEKFAYVRQFENKANQDAIKKWWDEKIIEFEKHNVE